jgi:transcriptional regulator with XRE-family HTH domain
MGTNAVKRDATAKAVSANVNRLRKEQNLGLRGLANKLGEVGRPLGHSAVDQIEKGTRRVDVDDLMALAAALGVSPATLLMPGMPCADNPEKVETTGVTQGVVPAELWNWLKAAPWPPPWIPLSQPVYEGNALPAWEWARWYKDTH